MEYTRVSNDVNGNPRYVFHFLDFVNDDDKQEAKRISNGFHIINLKDIAVEKSREIGGKVYRGKDFGGGIVLQSYNIAETIREIQKIQSK